MKGYKASFNGKCYNDFQFEVGKTYELNYRPIICRQGFHFCRNVHNVIEYYDIMDRNFVLFEIETLGEVVTRGNKSCTNKIKIVRIIPRTEYHKLFKHTVGFYENGNIRYNNSNHIKYKWDEHGTIIDMRYTYTYSGCVYVSKFNLKKNIWETKVVKKFDLKKNKWTESKTKSSK
jgi:hypothetical protein